MATALRASLAEVTERVAAQIEDRGRLERMVTELRKMLATGSGAAAIEASALAMI